MSRPLSDGAGSAGGAGLGAEGAFRWRTLAGSFWMLASYGGQQVMRLAGNLLLTRLLFPEAFGLMALVQTVIQGLQMFSDTGFNAGVIQNRRGEEEHFINTAWTLQVIRGGALWAATGVLAWPMASFYGQPELAWLIPVVGLRCVFHGFNSTALLRLKKRVHLKPIVVRNLTARGVSLVVMVGWAWWWPTVWVLVGGSVLQMGLEALLSYWVLPGPWPRFRWDREAAGVMFRFGRWLFLSTALTFLLQQGDRLVLGKMIGSGELGVYAIAAFLAQTLFQAVQVVNRQVMFPAYSHVAEFDAPSLRRRVGQSRQWLLALFVPGAWVLILFGSWIVQLLYDPRYADAGWILQIMAVGVVGMLVSQTASNVLLAVGDSFRFMLLQVVRSVVLIAGMAVGGWAGGMPGLVVGIAVSRVVDYPFVVWAVRPYGVWLPRQDGVVFASSGVVAALAYMLAL